MLATSSPDEAREEIGIDTSPVLVLGELTPVWVLVSGFTLHPVVGVTHERPAFVPAESEVAEILEVSLEDLRDASRIRRGTRIREGVAVEYPYFDLLGHQVWGGDSDDPGGVHLSHLKMSESGVQGSGAGVLLANREQMLVAADVDGPLREGE